MARDSAPPFFRATPMLLLVVGEKEAEEDDEVEDDEMGDDEMIKVASVMLKGWRYGEGTEVRASSGSFL